MFQGGKKPGFPGRDRRRGLLNHRLLLVGAGLAVAALFLLGQFGDSGLASWWTLRAEEAALQQEVTDLECGNRELERRLEDLAHNPEALEKVARENYRMKRKDEEVLTVLDRTETGAGTEGDQAGK